MIVQKKNIVIQRNLDRPILADLFYSKEQQQPIVIFCHGYKGFKDWGAWDLIAQKFAEAGFFFIKFNFSHNGGTIKQPIDFSDLDAFGQNNYCKELDDLDTVIHWVTAPNFKYREFVNPKRITLIGHSRGGGITLIKASEDSRVTKLITWASVSDYESRFPKGEELESWRQDGVFYVENGRTKQQMPHYFQFYTTFIENKERLTISKATKKITIPYLIIHGTADPTVDFEEAAQLHTWNPKSDLFLIQGADHVFGAKHPWNKEELPVDLATTVQKSINFAIL